MLQNRVHARALHGTFIVVNCRGLLWSASYASGKHRRAMPTNATSWRVSSAYTLFAYQSDGNTPLHFIEPNCMFVRHFESDFTVLVCDDEVRYRKRAPAMCSANPIPLCLAFRLFMCPLGCVFISMERNHVLVNMLYTVPLITMRYFRIVLQWICDSY